MPCVSQRAWDREVAPDVRSRRSRSLLRGINPEKLMKTTFMTTVAILAVGMTAGCSSSSRTERSAALGAATGAVIGGVIGHQSGETGTGAAIGAAVGGVAGGAYGRRQDRALDSSGYSSDDDYYMSLMRPDEVDILRARARASGRSNYDLTDFLTLEEKDNLRRRDTSRRGIGE